MNEITDKEKFINIVKEHKGIIYKVIHAYCKDANGRKDLEQEIMIQLWKSLKNYNEQYKLSTWIYRIALNVAISNYRKDVKRKNSNLPIEDEIFQIADEVKPINEETNIEQLNRFIQQLDDFNKAILVLYLEDKSYKEIAEIIGITETNVGTKINRIKKQLKYFFNQLNY